MRIDVIELSLNEDQWKLSNRDNLEVQFPIV